MKSRQTLGTLVKLLIGLAGFHASSGAAAEPLLELRHGDHVVYIGNTLADRMQHHAWLETYIHAIHPEHELTFRNLGFSGDEIVTRPRSENFGDVDQWLTKTKADVVFCFFGYNEALRGADALDVFEMDLVAMIDWMRRSVREPRTSSRASPMRVEAPRATVLPGWMLGTSWSEKA